MSEPVKIACLGEVMIELIAKENGQAAIGVAGDTYNTAVYMSKLASASDLQITYITALGRDKFSERITSAIDHYDINLNYIEYRADQMPGLYAIETDADGERSFSYWRGQSAAKTLFQEPCKIKLQSLLEFDLIYISGISMAILPPETRASLIDTLKQFRQYGGKLAFDSNYRPRLWESVQTARDVTMAMWAITDIALPSIDDEMLLFGDKNQDDVTTRIMNAGVTYGALKRGADGPFALGNRENKMTFEKVTNIIDTTAAGDSFNAGFLYQYAIGSSLEDAMQAGHSLASKVIQAHGAILDIA